jgi:hypothetical protein
MDETGLVEALVGLFDNDTGLDEVDPLVEDTNRVSTYEQAGMLTSNKGLVLLLNDGSEFQLTVVQSKWARDE